MTVEGTTEPIEMLTVSAENIAVQEELTQKNGGWAISFTLTSKCDQSVAVRISVPMPDEPAQQDVGFHPKHEPEAWRIRDGILTFEDRVPPEEPLVIMLGIVLVDDEDVSLSLSEPTIELSQPVESEEEVDFMSKEAPIFRSNSIGSTEQGSDSIADRLGAEPQESVDEPDQAVESREPAADVDAEGYEGVGTADSVEDVGPSETDADPAQSSDSVTTADSTGDLLTELVEQLESAEPDAEPIAALRRLLVPDRQKAMDVRLQHVQSRMDELAAYTGALEGLINKHGTASEFMAEMEEALDRVTSDIEAVRESVDDADADRHALHGQLEDVESAVEGLRARTEHINEDLDSIRATIESQEETVRSLRESVAGHDEAVESLTERVEAAEDGIEDHRDALDQRLSTLSNQVVDIQKTVEPDLDRIQDEVQSLSEMRDVFAKAFARAGSEEMDDVDEDEAE